MSEPPKAGEPRGRRGGCLLLLAVVALWWYLLHDFVTTPITVLLSVVGATLVYGGLYLSLAGARYDRQKNAHGDSQEGQQTVDLIAYRIKRELSCWDS